jgi:hypothetical protein
MSGIPFHQTPSRLVTTLLSAFEEATGKRGRRPTRKNRRPTPGPSEHG